MSELRNAQAAVDALDAQIASLRDVVAVSSLQDEDAIDHVRVVLASVAAAIDGKLHASMEKFRERTKMVDPVTNEPRFGPKTMAKVLEMLVKYDALYAEATGGGLLARLRDQIDAYDVRRVSEEREKQAALAASLEAMRRRQQEEQQRIEQAQREQQQRELEAEQARVAELARLAQLKREERERDRLAEEARIREQQEQLAHLNASAKVGVDGLAQAVETLRESIKETVEQRKALEKLLAIVSTICSSPENSAFRQIPKSNAHFHLDIGQYTGGYDCILALGFKELEPEPEKRVFVMEEPDLSEDFDKWSAWFDGLKEMKAWLESSLAQLR